jgi:hypothetical protein
MASRQGEQTPENRCRPPENLCIHHEGRRRILLVMAVVGPP